MRRRFIEWAEPVFGELAWLVIPDQPVLSAIGGILGVLIASRWARLTGLVWWKTLLAGGGAALVGSGMARVFWIFTVWDKFLDNPWLLIDPYRGGQTSFGALTGAAIGSALTLWILRAPIRKHADLLAPCGLLGIAFARVGCLMRSCDYGIATTLPWSVQYPRTSAVFRRHLHLDLVEPGAALSLPVHPFPLYLSAWALVCFATAVLRPDIFGKRPGQRAVGVGLMYLVGRFCLEFLRQPGNAPTVIGPLNAGHAFAVGSIVVLAAIYALVTAYDRKLESQGLDGGQRLD